METILAMVGLAITILLWLFPPEPIRKLFKLDTKRSDTGSLRFLIRLGNLSSDYWDEVDKPVAKSMIQPFQEKYSQSFQVSISKFVDDVDPSFDITIISEIESPVVIHKLGVEIESIAHEMKAYGMAQAAEILQQASYTINIPNIRTDIASESGRFPRLLEPKKINKFLSVNKPDIFGLEPENTFRYELLLKNYVAHMPNYAILRFWIETQNQKYFSNSIQIFTL